MKMHNIIIFVLALVTFSRVLEVVFGVPAIINIIHFPIIFIVFCLSLNKTINKKNPLIFGLIILFFVILISALINSAGLINIFLEFLLFTEPFMLLIMLVNIDYTKEAVQKLGKWLLFFGLVQIPFALYQWFVSSGGISDLVRGTMISMVNGSHIVGAISIICAIYLVYYYRLKPLWLKYCLIIFLLIIPILSDAKQAILVFLISYLILTITRIKNPKKAIKYALLALLVIVIAFKILQMLIPGLFLFNQEIMTYGIEGKLAIFPLLNSYQTSPSGWLFGLGPGHTVGRLAFMLPKYEEILKPFGATKSPITQETWRLGDKYWTLWVSSLFAPLFSWAGVLGDIGIIGFFVYLSLFLIVYNRFCKDDVSKLFLISILVLGCIFEWTEEPNFMLYIMATIGQIWLANKIKGKKAGYKEKVFEKFLNKNLQKILNTRQIDNN